MINDNLEKVQGYYCNWCNRFTRPAGLKKTYTVEVIGKKITIKDIKTACPYCDSNRELEEFNPSWWSHLVAFAEVACPDALWVKVPIYNSNSDPLPVAYKTVRTAREAEALAGRYCLEVTKATLDEFDLLDVEVELV